MRATKRRQKRVVQKLHGLDLHQRHGQIIEFNLDIEHFEIVMSGEAIDYQADDTEREEPGVEYRMSERLIKNLRILQHIDPHRPILIDMKTCGGDWVEGMAIFDAMLLAPNPITILNWTHSRSMSSLIMQAADRRIMAPNSYFLIHEGSNSASGTNKHFDSYADWSRQFIKPAMMAIYIQTLKTRSRKYGRYKPSTIEDELQFWMDRKEDVYFTAYEAVEVGFVDEVFTDGNWEALKKYPSNYAKKKRERAVAMFKAIHGKVSVSRSEAKKSK